MIPTDNKTSEAINSRGSKKLERKVLCSKTMSSLLAIKEKSKGFSSQIDEKSTILDNAPGRKFVANYEAAESLHDMGFSVFPLWGITKGKCNCGKSNCGSPGKHPQHTLAPKGFVNASNKIDDIDAWWGEAPNANIGVATGGDIVVIDIDGPVGEETLNRIQGEIVSLPPTLEAKTGNGRHLYFHKPPQIRISNSKPDNWDKLDVRGDGGYVVGPGSTHYSGKIYAWVDPSQPMAQLPREWVEVLATLKTEVTSIQTVGGGKVGPGGRNEMLSPKVYQLRKLGLDGAALFNAAQNLNQQFCAPPITDSEIRAMCKGKQRIEPEPIVTHRCDSELLDDLLLEDIPPTNWVVPNLLPSGLTILGGKPKAGKSWFALTLCLDVAAGKPIFGYFKCSPQKVLYLALEDHKRRLQDRAAKLLSGSNTSGNLRYATDWAQFPSPKEKVAGINGLSELRNHIIEHDIKLVVVDTWQKIRPEGRNQSNEYRGDYNHLSELQVMARDLNCAIILVHHLRKDNEGSDIQDMLLGSTGIQGAADLMWILKRKNDEIEGTLTPIGREIEDSTPLVFSFSDGAWMWKGKKTEVNRSKNQTAVLNALEQSDKALSFTEIVKASGVTKNSLGKVLTTLREQGWVEYAPVSKLYTLPESWKAEDNNDLFN